MKQYFIERKNELAFVAILNVLFIIAFNLLFYPRFHSDLDILMQSAVYGVSGISSSYILYSNIIIGKFLTILLSFVDETACYILFHNTTVFISLFIMTYITIKRNKSLTGKILATVMVAFIGYECYVEPNYMKTAALLSVCAAYLFLYAYETKARKKIMPVILLTVLSSMICLSVCIITSVVGYGIVFAYCWKKGCNKNWTIILITTALSIIILATGARLFDNAVYSLNGKAESLSYRNSMEKILGYGVPDYSEDMLDTYGLDGTQYNSISQGMFFSEGNNAFELVKEISNETQAFSFETISNFFKAVPISLFKTGMLYYLIVLCAISFLVGDRKNLMIGTLIMLLVEYFLFYMFNAWKVEWISFIVMLPISLLLLIGTKRAVVKDRESMIAYIIVLSVILYSNFSSTMVTSVREEGTEALYMQAQPEYVYVVDMVEYLKAGSVYDVYDRIAIPGNVFLVNGAYGLMGEFTYWTTLNPPAEGGEYYWLYNPAKLGAESLFLREENLQSE